MDKNAGYSKIGDDQVVITICFCDENCSSYNLVKEHENRKICEPKPVEGKRNFQFQQRLNRAKRKVVDCRQVRIPASINVVTDNFNSKRYKNCLNSFACGAKKGDGKNANRANGMQDTDSMFERKVTKTCPPVETANVSNSFTMPDMTVSVNGTDFKCSSLLLKKYSGFFRDLEIDDTCKIYLCGICINEEVFSTVYTWMQMYVGESFKIVNENNIVDLLSACLFLMLADLELSCWEMICDPVMFSGEKAFKIYKRSIDKNFCQITETVFRRVLKYFPVLVNTEEFLKSDTEHLVPVLSSDEICCNSEMEVFLAVSKWIFHDLDSRWDHLTRLVDTVRFGLMSSEQLCRLSLSEVPRSFRMIVTHPYTSKKIENGMILNSLRAEFNYPKESCQGFWYKCRELGLEVPKERVEATRHLQVCICHTKK